jgi:hypothetical protein
MIGASFVDQGRGSLGTRIPQMLEIDASTTAAIATAIGTIILAIIAIRGEIKERRNKSE